MCVVGSINADLVVHTARHPQPGETLLGSGGTITAGGKGANQAVAAARLGAKVSFVGAVGSDAYAAPAMHYLQASGVDLTHVEASEEVTGLAVITVDTQGENTIIVVPGANALVSASFVTTHSSPITASDLILLQGEVPAEGFAKAIELAKGRVVVNLAPVIEVDKEALLRADPLLANEHEAGLILEQLGLSGEGAPEELARRLTKAGFASVVSRWARGERSWPKRLSLSTSPPRRSPPSTRRAQGMPSPARCARDYSTATTSWRPPPMPLELGLTPSLEKARRRPTPISGASSPANYSPRSWERRFSSFFSTSAAMFSW